MCLVGVFYFTVCDSSSGDRSAPFRGCLIRCVTVNCSSDERIKLSLSLRVLAWDCPSNCQYQCMRIMTDQDVHLGRPVRQFYGKVRLKINDKLDIIFVIYDHAVAICSSARNPGASICHFLCLKWSYSSNWLLQISSTCF